MRGKVNSYIAILLITIVGSGAALLIVQVATDNAISSTFGGSEAAYSSLRQSILEQ